MRLLCGVAYYSTLQFDYPESIHVPLPSIMWCYKTAGVRVYIVFLNNHVLFCYSVKYPAAITSVIEADYHQKVVMKFSLKSESSGELFTPHQARINECHLQFFFV